MGFFCARRLANNNIIWTHTHEYHISLPMGKSVGICEWRPGESASRVLQHSEATKARQDIQKIPFLDCHRHGTVIKIFHIFYLQKMLILKLKFTLISSLYQSYNQFFVIKSDLTTYFFANRYIIYYNLTISK